MSRRFVIDASIGLAWVHPDQSTPETDALLDEIGQGVRAIIPTLWPVEVTNALLVLERRKKLKKDERLEALAMLRTLNPDVDEEGHRFAFTRVTELAEEHGLSVYDATYLELALRERVPLATKDASLRQAATKAGVLVR